MVDKFDENDPVATTSELVAYRLGRVEKAVEATNQKLDTLTELGQQVSKNSWRLDSLEASRTRTYQFLTGIATALIIVMLQLFFKMI